MRNVEHDYILFYLLVSGFEVFFYFKQAFVYVGYLYARLEAYCKIILKLNKFK